MSAAGSVSSDIPLEEPSWLYAATGEPALTQERAANFLGELDEEDFSIFVLAYGLGMRFGGVARTLRLDPALVVWRLRRSLERWRRNGSQDDSPRALESGVTELLRTPNSNAPAPPRELPSWNARDLVEELTEKVRERLSDQLEAPTSTPTIRPGVGIGLAVVILLGALALGVFGALRDESPLREGRRLMSQRKYGEARAAFVRLGSSVEGRKRVALCFIGEGEFERAFELFGEVDVLASLGQFAPHDRPVAPEPGLGSGAALLPRGKLRNPRPRFIIAGHSSGELRLTSPDGTPRSFHFDSESSTALEGEPTIYRVNYPRDWSEPLAAGDYEWELVGEPSSRARFHLISSQRRVSIASHFDSHLPSELAGAPSRFLKAQFFLNQGLLTHAAEELAGLTRAFPSASYPAERLADVCAALGVDPSAFAR
ncbi:MAG: hypothetical protein DHS20C15_16810 [Planctomycetota bacterium]|nr:MAG: hypothetical protein DHS20C15_16810 [Planctomycetota bacterium]